MQFAQSIRLSLRIVAGICLLTLASVYAIHRTNAQDPPRPPQPKQTPTPSKDQKEKQGSRRQGAQADEQTLDPEGTIKVDTDLVALDVTVTDQANQPVFDLKKEDFTVFEDKVKQEIEAVLREEVPVSFGLVIDTSGSMRAKLQQVSDAALLLVKTMRQNDEAFVASFKAEPELVQDFTGDRRDLEDALNELYSSGGTSLLDAIIATADYAQQKAKQRRKALIIITDGLEKNSSVKEKEVLDALKEDEAQIYLVGFIDEDDNEKGLFGKSPAKKARELLTRLAGDSGGRAFFPKEVSEMPTIAEQIAKDLRTQYVVYYTPSNLAKDGTFRNVKVVVEPKGNRKLSVRTRQGYYARDTKTQQQNSAPKKTRSE
ncbi:MAG TPA: VWA domain-containing protein [Blastocatellia bacterium]|nr:VWA domain-containing protein [Blastocatellia bacterium]HMY71952.1 VWA domain-containing protein [Blastocatellia bacterium]HMZ21000.1 VWA domain-containing protein [Blastocatellia bacterium]HNG28812.1 VWA domain-containing protein [Blastocatellia bacterium]